MCSKISVLTMQSTHTRYIKCNLSESPRLGAPEMLPWYGRTTADTKMQADEATIPKVPGYGLPVDYMPSEQKHFPRLMLNHFGQPSWNAHTLLIKELCIFRVVEELTNKPEWWLKVRKDEIADKWKKEMLETDWKTKFTLWAHFTKGMADAVSRHRHPY